MARIVQRHVPIKKGACIMHEQKYNLVAVFSHCEGNTENIDVQIPRQRVLIEVHFHCHLRLFFMKSDMIILNRKDHQIYN